MSAGARTTPAACPTRASSPLCPSTNSAHVAATTGGSGSGSSASARAIRSRRPVPRNVAATSTAPAPASTVASGRGLQRPADGAPRRGIAECARESQRGDRARRRPRRRRTTRAPRRRHPPAPARRRARRRAAERARRRRGASPNARRCARGRASRSAAARDTAERPPVGRTARACRPAARAAHRAPSRTVRAIPPAGARARVRSRPPRPRGAASRSWASGERRKSATTIAPAALGALNGMPRKCAFAIVPSCSTSARDVGGSDPLTHLRHHLVLVVRHGEVDLAVREQAVQLGDALRIRRARAPERRSHGVEPREDGVTSRRVVRLVGSRPGSGRRRRRARTSRPSGT